MGVRRRMTNRGVEVRILETGILLLLLLLLLLLNLLCGAVWFFGTWQSHISSRSLNVVELCHFIPSFTPTPRFAVHRYAHFTLSSQRMRPKLSSSAQFYNMKNCLQWEIFHPSSNTQGWVPPLVGYPHTTSAYTVCLQLGAFSRRRLFHTPNEEAPCCDD